MILFTGLGVSFFYRPNRMETDMTQGKPLNEGQFIKVPLAGDLQRGQNLKIPAQLPQTQPTQAPVQPAQSQTGGTKNGGK